MIQIKNEIYYTSKELCQKLGINKRLLEKLVKNNKLNVYKISERKFLYSESDIEKLIKG